MKFMPSPGNLRERGGHLWQFLLAGKRWKMLGLYRRRQEVGGRRGNYLCGGGCSQVSWNCLQLFKHRNLTLCLDGAERRYPFRSKFLFSALSMVMTLAYLSHFPDEIFHRVLHLSVWHTLWSALIIHSVSLVSFVLAVTCVCTILFSVKPFSPQNR